MEVRYWVEIIIKSGPIGYQYSDSYSTGFLISKNDAIEQGEILNLSIKKGLMERSRRIYLRVSKD